MSSKSSSTSTIKNVSVSETSTTSSLKSFEDLPEKVLLKIFENFNERDLTRSVLPVCQKWKYLALNPALWKTLVIGRLVPMKQVCQKIRYFTELENLYLKNVANPTRVLRHITLCAKNLKQISIRHTSDIKEQTLRNLIHVCANLEKLDLKGVQFKGKKFYLDLIKLKKLKSLNFSDNKYLTKQNVFSVVLNCHQLEEFILSSDIGVDDMSETEWSFVIRSLSSNLKSICIDASTIGNHTFHTIIQCPNIEAIGFCGAYNLSSNVFEKITEYPIKLTTLKLRFAHLIDGPSITEVFTANDMSDLKTLDLTGCWRITDAALDAIAACVNLEKLILKSCKRITNLNAIVGGCLRICQLNVAFCDKLLADKSLLTMPKLEVLFINEDPKFSDILEAITSEQLNIRVKICLSEYNKEYRCLK